MSICEGGYKVINDTVIHLPLPGHGPQGHESGKQLQKLLHMLLKRYNRQPAKKFVAYSSQL